MADGSVEQAVPIKGIEAVENDARSPGHPPVHLWNPPFCGNLDIRIASDGTWYYLGTPIHRARLVRLFASVLRREEDGQYYLVTPVEKIGITVDDAPFVAVAMSASGAGEGQRLGFSTNVGDTVVAGPEHPLRFELDPANGGLKPYLLVRGRLEALVSRAATYDLVEAGVQRMVNGSEVFGIWSGGRFFDIAPAGEV